LLKTGLTTIQRNYSIINLLKSFYRLANLNLKFGDFIEIIGLFNEHKYFHNTHFKAFSKL
ncbi:hypothetical protein ACLIIH_08145, partial [Streptococcus equi subsp. zooepidemicus]|uniref:hypothetical protein n=1 Tax=Streptococcus equi TaxID=1336 RepID=UPI0039862714